MREAATGLGLEDAVGQWLRVIGLGIEILAAMVIVGGLIWSTYLFLRRRMAEQHYETYKIRIGRSLLLGLEVVVAADIVKTIAVAPTLMSLAVLAGLVPELDAGARDRRPLALAAALGSPRPSRQRWTHSSLRIVMHLMLLFAYRTRSRDHHSDVSKLVLRERREAVERTNGQPSHADGIRRQGVRERSRLRQSAHVHK